MPSSSRAPNLAVLVAEFHETLAASMLASALDEAELGGAKVLVTLRVPGAYETPLIAEQLLARRGVDALVVLGFIERGETLHGEVMGHVVHRALLEASLRHGKPVGLGLIGPGATREQAEVRKDRSARAAVRAVLHGTQLLSELLGGAKPSPTAKGTKPTAPSVPVPRRVAAKAGQARRTEKSDTAGTRRAAKRAVSSRTAKPRAKSK